MASRKSKSRRSAKAAAPKRLETAETRTSDAATVGWTVSITTVLLCNVAAVLAHFYVRWNPQARGMAVLGELMLFAGAVVGVVSLALLPIVYRLRRVPPPRGFTVFAACAALAPILAAIVRIMQA